MPLSNRYHLMFDVSASSEFSLIMPIILETIEKVGQKNVMIHFLGRHERSTAAADQVISFSYSDTLDTNQMLKLAEPLRRSGFDNRCVDVVSSRITNGEPVICVSDFFVESWEQLLTVGKPQVNIIVHNTIKFEGDNIVFLTVNESNTLQSRRQIKEAVKLAWDTINAQEKKVESSLDI